ncbi:peptidoglycan DD-metalloendopeptidase family protein [Candidatus Kuenenbacteria bacterium]|nr:peptidoglycan DD-metalloendopeptidase family protein [Candidatus Kuenenbacteria bacterium]
MVRKFLIKKVYLLITISVLWAVLPLAPSGSAAENEAAEKTAEELSAEIKNKQGEIDALREKISAYEKSLGEERSKATSLRNQIYILETQIEKKEAEIQLNQDEIEETELNMKNTQAKIKKTGADIVDKQNKVSKFLRSLYQLDQKTDIEIIVMNESLSDFFNQAQTTEKLQTEINDMLIGLKKAKAELEQNKSDLEGKNLLLNELKTKLEERKANLEDQTDGKQIILQQTRSSEARYQSLIAELKQEQNKINADIVYLEKAMRQKLDNSGNKLQDLGDVIFIWPVPGRTVTSSFRDPDYPFRNVYEHPAIDIRAPQGTAVRAAASGYIARVQNGGAKGYSYVMIIHNDGFSTVYGHLSAIYVETDQFVNQGDVIGLSGGMPGTPGAGRMTTGPHLHFEVRSNGIPVNPEDYLP